MAKPNPVLLDPARYPFSCTIETRYRDLDSNLHINNGVMASLFEEGRVRFHRAAQFGPLSEDDDGSAMVVSLAIEFLGESHFPDPLDIHLGIARIGTTSYELLQLARQQGNVVCFARVTLVSTRQGAPYAISPQRREAAQQWMFKL